MGRRIWRDEATLTRDKMFRWSDFEMNGGRARNAKRRKVLREPDINGNLRKGNWKWMCALSCNSLKTSSMILSISCTEQLHSTDADQLQLHWCIKLMLISRCWMWMCTWIWLWMWMWMWMRIWMWMLGNMSVSVNVNVNVMRMWTDTTVSVTIPSLVLFSAHDHRNDVGCLTLNCCCSTVAACHCSADAPSLLMMRHRCWSSDGAKVLLRDVLLAASLAHVSPRVWSVLGMSWWLNKSWLLRF